MLKSFWVRILHGKNLLSPCRSKYLNKISTCQIKLNLGLGGFKLNIPVTYFLMSRCLFIELNGGT